MTSKGRAGIVLVALVAAGVGAAVYLREPDGDAHGTDAGPAADASVDGHATVAKAKAPNKKKPSGKPRVAGHTTRVAPGTHAGGAHSGGAHHGSGTDQHGGKGAASARGAHPHHVSPSGSSYESALDSNNQHVTIGANAGSDLTDAQLSAPLRDGTFVSECGAPDDMGVTVKVAIRMGHVVGVSVSTNPHSAEVAGCIEHHIRGLSWPAHANMDSFVTTY